MVQGDPFAEKEEFINELLQKNASLLKEEQKRREIAERRAQELEEELRKLKLQSSSTVVFSSPLSSISTAPLGANTIAGMSRSSHQAETKEKEEMSIAKDSVLNEKFSRQLKFALAGNADAQCTLGQIYRYGEQGILKNDVKALEWFQKSAAGENPRGQRNLGMMYEEGLGGLERNADKAKTLYQSAFEKFQVADQGDPEVQCNLGCMYAQGHGVAKNEKKACELYELAANQGHAPAQYHMGRMYWQGRGVAKDEKQAFRWCEAAANQNYAQAQFYLGAMYANGQGVTKKTFEWWERAAKQGHADAQFYLGAMYANDEGVTKDDKKTCELLELAANQGHAGAQYHLGLMYAQGRGIAKNYKKACKLFELAANQGDTDARCNLGIMYSKGHGVPKNDKKACELYEAAAKQGHADAQYNLGFMYDNGRGVPKNEKKACELYEAAAKQRQALAQCNLGVMYANGQCVPKNEKKACELYEAAAKQGHVQAQCNLKVMYAQGRGIAKDYKKGCKGFELGTNQEHAHARFTLRFMYVKGRRVTKYENGPGVPKDDKKACAWYEAGAAQSDIIPDLQSSQKKSTLMRQKQGLFNTTMQAFTRGLLQDLLIKADLWLETAYSGGDCFYDSIAQVINEVVDKLPGMTRQDIKSLRALCSNYVVTELERGKQDENWVKKWLTKGNDYENYRSSVRYTQEELDEFLNGPSKICLGDGYAIWGQPEVDGRIIYKKFGIKLHIIGLQPDKIYHQIVDENGVDSIEEKSINYHDSKIIHIVNYNDHFVPALKAPPVPLHRITSSISSLSSSQVLLFLSAPSTYTTSSFSNIQSLSFSSPAKFTNSNFSKNNSGKKEEKNNDSKEELSKENIPNVVIQESLNMQNNKELVGPRQILGWVLDDVEAKGNCFYLAVIKQFEKLQHPFLREVQKGTDPHHVLRLRLKGNQFRDGEYADFTEIFALCREFSLTVAIVDTRYPETGFRYYYIDNKGDIKDTHDIKNLPHKIDKECIKLAYTGNHYLSVRLHPSKFRFLSPFSTSRLLTAFMSTLSSTSLHTTHSIVMQMNASLPALSFSAHFPKQSSNHRPNIKVESDEMPNIVRNLPTKTEHG